MDAFRKGKCKPPPYQLPSCPLCRCGKNQPTNRPETGQLYRPETGRLYSLAVSAGGVAAGGIARRPAGGGSGGSEGPRLREGYAQQRCLRSWGVLVGDSARHGE